MKSKTAAILLATLVSLNASAKNNWWKGLGGLFEKSRTILCDGGPYEEEFRIALKGSIFSGSLKGKAIRYQMIGPVESPIHISIGSAKVIAQLVTLSELAVHPTRYRLNGRAVALEHEQLTRIEIDLQNNRALFVEAKSGYENMISFDSCEVVDIGQEPEACAENPQQQNCQP